MTTLSKLSSTSKQYIRENWYDLSLFVGLVATIAWVMTSAHWRIEQTSSYATGEIARQTLRAPHDLLVEDILGTEKRREEVLQSVPTVFSISSERQAESTKHLNYLFSAIKELAETRVSSVEPVRAVLTQEQREEIEKRFRLNLVGPEWDIVSNSSNWPKLDSAVSSITGTILAKGIIADKRVLRSAIAKSRAVLREKGKSNEVVLLESSVLDFREALDKSNASFPLKGFGRGPAFDSVVRKLVELSLQPNVRLDTEESEQRLKQALQQVDASMHRIRRGQVLVREGDLVTASQQALISQFQGEKKAGTIVLAFLGYFSLTLLSLLISYSFIWNFWTGIKLAPRDLRLLGFSLLGTLVTVKVFSILGDSLSYGFSWIDEDSFLLATPIAAGGILLQSTLGACASLCFTLALSLLTPVFLENSWLFLVLVSCGNLVGALALKTCTRRSSFIRAGAKLAGLNLLIGSSYLLFFPETNWSANLALLVFAAIGGLSSGILAGGLTPLLEYFGGYVTDIKLLELASLDRPLLRDLSLQAPGTWNHSMVMGQIAEAAAEAIGANPLLARVGAYYHDIGKVTKPAYFIENQGTRENRHDKLTPSMSVLIIKAHVKDGLELAQAHRLPKVLSDFITQHHGNSLIEYFYEKALREAAEGEVVDESHYRYQGPRPQTKEAGILMLADAVEASSRTLSDPSPAKIQGLVQKIINKVFSSGELSECNLTLQDLHRIAKSFTRVLTGIYHRRVEYSEPAEKVKETKESKPAKNKSSEPEADVKSELEVEAKWQCQDTVTPKQAEETPVEPLRRLGMH